MLNAMAEPFPASWRLSDLCKDLIGFLHPSLVDEISKRVIELRLYSLADLFDLRDHMVLHVRMKPTLKTLVTGQDHKRKRSTRDISLRQKRGNVPDPSFDRIIITNLDTGRSRMLYAFQQFIDTAPPDSDGFYHFDAEDLRKRFLIDDDAATPRLIIHIEIENKRYTHFRQLERYQEAPSQVLGIGNLNDYISAVREQHVPRYLFVLGHGHQAVHTGGVDHDCLYFIQDRVSVRHFHGGAGIIGHGDIGTRQKTEKGAFSNIRITNQKDLV